MGCHFLLQGNLPDPGIEPGSPTFQADALTTEPPGKPQNFSKHCLNLIFCYMPCTHGQLIYDKRIRIYKGERIISSINGVGKIGKLDSQMQKNKTGPLFYIIKVNSKWIKDLKVRSETATFLGKNIVNNLLGIHLGICFFISFDTKSKGNKSKNKQVGFNSVQSLNSLQLHGLRHSRPPCPSPTPGVYPNSCASSR